MGLKSERKRKRTWLLPVLILVSVAACARPAPTDPALERYNDGRSTGQWSRVGGAVGGYAGATIGQGTGRMAATAAGALTGAVLGTAVGRAEDRERAQDKARVWEPLRRGEVQGWPGDASGGYAGSLGARRTLRGAPTSSPTPAQAPPHQPPCRDIETTIQIEGRPQKAWMRYCQGRDGHWYLVP